MSRVWPVTFIAASIATASARAIDVPDYDFEWAVIGDPGNRPTLPNEVPFLVAGGAENTELGRVDKIYRVATKEITAEQWLEFVVAYLPHYWKLTGYNLAHSDFTSTRIRVVFGVAEIMPGVSPQIPVGMHWVYAARYCNWLHNGKGTDLEDFESGVYEASTFYEDPPGHWHFQAERNPGSRFWLPSYDEWIKAAYYDPERYGQGLPGYWFFQNSSNRQPIGGLLPEDGGERNAGYGPEFPLDVGSFPDIRSPWGLLDCSGGVEEWLETHRPSGCFDGSDCLHRRIVGGTQYGDPSNDDPFTSDRLGFSGTFTIGGSSIGFRIASAVPCVADNAPPVGIFDLRDISMYVDRYLGGDESADLAEPLGVLDFADIMAFIHEFSTRCGIVDG